MEWLEKEYQRLIAQGCLDNDEKLDYYNEIVVINGSKILKRSQIKNHFESSVFKVEEDKNLIGIGKDFLQEYNKNDKWS